MAFEIIIDQNVHDKIMHWVRKSDKEVSGFGTVIRNEETGSFEIQDAFLLEQEVGAAHTDIDDKALAKLMFETKDHTGDLKWWWHSHVNMDVFWSSQDKETILELGKHGWIIASVFNKSEEVHSALCYQYDYESEFGKGKSTSFHDDIETTILLNVDEDEIKRWDEEFTKKVREKSTVVTMPTYPYDRGATPASGEKTSTIIKSAGPYDESYWSYGLLGYGLQAEAEALNMTVAGYASVLDAGHWKQMEQLETRLELLERQGKLKGEKYDYYSRA